jgi:hypothetical protein
MQIIHAEHLCLHELHGSAHATLSPTGPPEPYDCHVRGILHHEQAWNGSLRYNPNASAQDHPQRPRNEAEVTQVGPRFFFFCNDLTITLRVQLDQMFHSIGRSVSLHLQRWMAELIPSLLTHKILYQPLLILYQAAPRILLTPHL